MISSLIGRNVTVLWLAGRELQKTSGKLEAVDEGWLCVREVAQRFDDRYERADAVQVSHNMLQLACVMSVSAIEGNNA